MLVSEGEEKVGREEKRKGGKVREIKGRGRRVMKGKTGSSYN